MNPIDRLLGKLFDPSGKRLAEQEQRIERTVKRSHQAFSLIDEFRKTQSRLSRRWMQ